MAAFLARVYERRARDYFILFLCVLLTVILTYSGGAVLAFGRYLRMDRPTLELMELIAESGIVVGLAIAALISRQRETALIDWVTHAERDDAEAGVRAANAWTSLASLPLRVVIRAEVIVAVITAPPLLLAAETKLHVHPVALLLLTIGMVALELGCGSFALILIDIFLRPVRTEIDAALPTDFRPVRHGIGMGQRIAIELFILMWPPTVLTASVVIPPGQGGGGLAKVYAIGFVVTAAFSGLIGVAIVERVSAPIRDLIAGTQSVAGGNLSVRVR